MNNFQVFTTKEEATNYAVNKYTFDYVDLHIVNVIRIGPTIAKFLSCEVGYAIDEEMDGEE